MFEDLGEGPHYEPPGEHVAFGDVFHSAFMRDVFVRSDCELLGGGPLPPTLAPRVARWMNHQLDERGIDLYSPAFTAKPDTRWALAHAAFKPDGLALHAVLISDSCLASTALAQGRVGRSVAGRLLFAPLSFVDEQKWSELVEKEDFGRFPLPPDERLPDGSVAELACCFMADARDVKEHAAERAVSMRPALGEELEAHWSAYATRRGPRAYERNALKLAVLLSNGEPSEHAVAVTDQLAGVLDCTWVLEGRDLEDISEAEEAVRHGERQAADLTPALVRRVSGRLRELSALAMAAADALERTEK